MSTPAPTQPTQALWTAPITGFLHFSISVMRSCSWRIVLYMVMDFLAMSSSLYTMLANWLRSDRSMPEVNILPAPLITTTLCPQFLVQGIHLLWSVHFNTVHKRRGDCDVEGVVRGEVRHGPGPNQLGLPG